MERSRQFETIRNSFRRTIMVGNAKLISQNSKSIENLLASEVMGYGKPELNVETNGVTHAVYDCGVWKPFEDHSQLFACYAAAKKKWDECPGRDCSYNVAFVNELKSYLFETKQKYRCTIFDEADLANAWAECPFYVGCAILSTCDVEVVLWD